MKGRLQGKKQDYVVENGKKGGDKKKEWMNEYDSLVQKRVKWRQTKKGREKHENKKQLNEKEWRQRIQNKEWKKVVCRW